MIETFFVAVSPGVSWLTSNQAMHALNGNIWPVIIYGIVAAGGAAVATGAVYVYETFIDSDPPSIQYYNLNAPETLNGGTYNPTLYGGDQPGSDGSLIAGIGTGTLLALAVGGYFLLKN